MNWLLVAVIVAATTAADVLQSAEMKRHAAATIANTAAQFFRRPLLLIAIACMAISFFAFTVLLASADLSFAVPATAFSYVLETILARVVLREQIEWRRWTGALLVTAGVVLLAA